MDGIGFDTLQFQQRFQGGLDMGFEGGDVEGFPILLSKAVWLIAVMTIVANTVFISERGYLIGIIVEDNGISDGITTVLVIFVAITLFRVLAHAGKGDAYGVECILKPLSGLGVETVDLGIPGIYDIVDIVYLIELYAMRMLF
jgi:uncharacterized membrane protein